MAKIISYILLLFTTTLSYCTYVPFEDCGSAFYLESIEVSNCNGYPCRLKIGSLVNVTTNLLIQGENSNTEEFVQDVYFVISNILLKAEVLPDPCSAVRGQPNNQQSQSCLLRSGERIAYQSIIDVQNFPPLPAKLYWTIRNRSTGEQVVCYKLTVLLTNG